MTLELPRALLEDWLREAYFTAVHDISSSGVEPYSMADLRAALDIPLDTFDTVVFRDSHSRGAAELRAAVAARFGCGDAAEVMITNGSCEAEFLFMTSFLDAGDEVIVVDPAYHTLGVLAVNAGCRVVPWRLRPQNGFRPDVGELRSLASESTKAIIVNLPHNPTGMSVGPEEMAQIIDIAAECDAYLVWDSVFRELVYDVSPLPDITTVYGKSVSFGSLSKAYGLPGLRIGWAFMPDHLIERCVVIRDYSTYAPSPLAEHVALHAVRGADVLLGRRVERARANLEYLQKWAHQHRSVVEFSRPDGGVCAFPKLLGIPDTWAFCEKLMNDGGVLLVPGECFGVPGHVRLGFGGESDSFRAGLAQLSLALLKE